MGQLATRRVHHPGRGRGPTLRDGCGDEHRRLQQPELSEASGFVYGLLTYGAPVVAAAAILLSFVTAGRRRGFLVPVIAWVLLLVDIAVLAATFS